MIPISPNPVLFSIGPISVYYYGLVYAFGFLFTYWFLRKRSKENKLSLNFEEIDMLMIYAIIGIIVGARLGEFLFFQTNVLVSTPLEVLKIWKGGMSIHGGIIGFALALSLFCKKIKRNIFFEITDTIVIPASLILFFGRVANFINAELVGTITTGVSWCVNYFSETINGELVCRHPSQLYEALKNLFIFISLISIDTFTHKRKIVLERGVLTWLFILLYGILRTITNIWRDDIRWLFNIFSTGQVLSLVMVLLAIFMLARIYFKKRKARKE
jgi:phosphatidylglycerol---prolipoprotein diacylglyceryl transferase